MGRFLFSNKAVEDLTDIWNYTADTWSEPQADAYYGMLLATCRKVADNPVLFGRDYRDVQEGIYGFKANRHILFYRILPDHILIVRILHERMDRSNKFGG